MQRRGWLAALALAQLLHIAGWGFYYSVSRSIAGHDPRVNVLLLAFAETLPSALSILSSSYASRRGYRGLLSLGFLEALGLALFGLLGWPLMLLASLLASTAWALAGPMLVAAVLEWGARGFRLGLVLAANAVGWSLGGFLGPLLLEAVGPGATMVVAGAAVGACYALALVYAPPLASRPGGSRATSLDVALYALAFSPLVAATEAAFSLVMKTISACLPPVFYAATLLATGVASAAGKLVAGRIVEKRGARLVYRLAFIAYAVWMLVSAHLPCTALAVAFVTPLYPFMELGFYEHVTPLLGERRASAAWAASYTIASLVLLALSAAGLGFRETLYTSALLAATALLLTWFVERRLLVMRGGVVLGGRVGGAAESSCREVPGDELRAGDSTRA